MTPTPDQIDALVRAVRAAHLGDLPEVDWVQSVRERARLKGWTVKDSAARKAIARCRDDQPTPQASPSAWAGVHPAWLPVIVVACVLLARPLIRLIEAIATRLW